ncbi:integrase [Pandoraea iniqua]|uniref:Integrase n=1 Tax=Pandoraea iniqua TaxID=2508288 RepID=A0A5E4YFC9_9BURK|nr:transposase family protein [Pandoraea iniqua]VVE47424.1 integrase [Pandoraea iniqua]
MKGFSWSHKHIYRIYRELTLNLRIKPKKRLVRQMPQPLSVPEAINEVRSTDFMQDPSIDGRSIWALYVIDDFNRKVLGIEVDFSLPSERVIRTLKHHMEWRGNLPRRMVPLSKGPQKKRLFSNAQPCRENLGEWHISELPIGPSYSVAVGEVEPPSVELRWLRRVILYGVIPSHEQQNFATSHTFFLSDSESVSKASVK